MPVHPTSPGKLNPANGRSGRTVYAEFAKKAAKKVAAAKKEAAKRAAKKEAK